MGTLVMEPATLGWEDYAHASGIDHFRWWAETYCVQSIDRFAGEPLALEDWQLDIMGEALAVSEDGSPYWATVIAVLPRKNGKSTMLSAYSTYHAVEHDGMPEVLLSASSDKQAGRLFDYCTAFIRRSEYLTDMFHLREHVGVIARKDGGGRMVRMASKPESAHGANPSLVVVDELHAFTTQSLRRFWAAQVSAGGARTNTQVYAITTAGEAHDRDDSILGQLIDANERDGDLEVRGALRISRNHDARVLIYNYAAPVDAKLPPSEQRKDFSAVRAANPASWVTDEYLRRQIASPELSDAEFLQLHANVWADSVEAFIPEGMWDALAGQLAGGANVSVAIDGSYTHDTTAVAAAWALPDGTVEVDCRVFSVRSEAPHHELHSETIDYQRVEDHAVSYLAGGVRHLGFDPRFLARSAEILSERMHGVPVTPIEPTSAHMKDALATFRRLATDGMLRHSGDQVIGAHVKATKGELTDSGWRLSKRKHARPIDAVPAMAMAVWLATREEVSPYERRGILVI